MRTGYSTAITAVLGLVALLSAPTVFGLRRPSDFTPTPRR
jgi:hypothetical protein